MSSAGSLSEDYANAGFGRRLGFGEKPALLVIDVARAYLEPSSPLYAGVEDVVGSIARVLDQARGASVPVVFTEVRFRPGSKDGGVFRRKVPALGCFEVGSPLGDLVPELEVRREDGVITKQYASVFAGTPLAANLRADGVDSVVVTGLTTSGCVRATVVDVCQMGFVPIVVRESVGDRHPAPHEANLFDMDAKYADVVSEKEVVEWLSADFASV